eukprot:3131701-Pyramimonas_sp.AAC.1
MFGDPRGFRGLALGPLATLPARHLARLARQDMGVQRHSKKSVRISQTVYGNAVSSPEQGSQRLSGRASVCASKNALLYTQGMPPVRIRKQPRQAAGHGWAPRAVLAQAFSSGQKTRRSRRRQAAPRAVSAWPVRP